MRVTKLLSNSLSACAIAATLALSAPVCATTLTNTTWLVPPGGESYTVHWNGNTRNGVPTGGFRGNFGDPPPGASIEFWCYDLDHFFSLGTTYSDYTAFQLIGSDAVQLAQLFQAAGGARSSDLDHSAAFQLAIWNIEYDSDLDVSAGSFRASGGANAIAIANTWLQDLHNHDGLSPTITYLQSASGHQNFITPNTVPSQCCRTVPEPPMLPLVLTAIGAVALVETRRRMRVRGE